MQKETGLSEPEVLFALVAAAALARLSSAARPCGRSRGSALHTSRGSDPISDLVAKKPSLLTFK